jgi:hypothetical protein
MTFPAALGCDRIDALCVFDGPVNAISGLRRAVSRPNSSVKRRCHRREGHAVGVRDARSDQPYSSVAEGIRRGLIA